MSPKVSIIVPVYKAEAYLHRCIDSLLNQTFQDYEILLIDDGSPDRSGKICDEYAKKDCRVRVFHKENSGVSSARQCGIDNALGEYTIHADPDDWVEPNMLEELYAKAKEKDADMVICDYYEEYSKLKKTIYKQQRPSNFDHDTVLKELFQQLHGSCWNKLVRRACYKKYDVSFISEMTLCEDFYVNFKLLMNPIKIGYCSIALYHYDRNVNPDSLTMKPQIKNFESKRLLISFIDKHNETDRFVEELYIQKKETIELAFRMGFSHDELMKIYPEVHQRYIKEYGNIIKNRLSFFVVFDLKGYERTSRLLFRIYKFLVSVYIWIRY